MPGHDFGRRQTEDLAEATVDDLAAGSPRRTGKAPATCCRAPRRAAGWSPSASPSCSFMQADVAADDDEAAVLRRAAADAQPAAVGQARLVARRRIRRGDRAAVPAPPSRALGRALRQVGDRCSGLQRRRRRPEEVGGLRVGQRDLAARRRPRRCPRASFRAHRRAASAPSGAARPRAPSSSRMLSRIVPMAESSAPSSSAPPRGMVAVQLAVGDPLGDRRGARDGPDDAARQQPGHQRRQQTARARCRSRLSCMSAATAAARVWR